MPLAQELSGHLQDQDDPSLTRDVEHGNHLKQLSAGFVRQMNSGPPESHHKLNTWQTFNTSSSICMTILIRMIKQEQNKKKHTPLAVESLKQSSDMQQDQFRAGLSHHQVDLVRYDGVKRA